MKNIYQAVSRAVVWLGRAGQDSDIALNIVEKRPNDINLLSFNANSSAAYTLPSWVPDWPLS
jgi:hypothetical protein